MKLSSGFTFEIAKLKDLDNLRKFLQQTALLHTYSFRNAVLIFAKCRNATQLKTYDGWKKVGRYVKLGETGIEIVRPSKNVVRGADGQPVTRIQFLTKTVFDISQTEGKEVREQRREPFVGADRYEQIYQAVEVVSPYKITFGQQSDRAGCCSPHEKKISIRIGLQDEEILQALFFQLAQAELLQDKIERQERRRQAEANGVAFLLLGYFRIGDGELNLQPLNEWCSTAPQEELADALESMYSLSRQLLNSIEDTVASLERAPVRSAAGADRTMHDLLSRASKKSVEIKKQREMSALENGLFNG